MGILTVEHMPSNSTLKLNTHYVTQDVVFIENYYECDCSVNNIRPSTDYVCDLCGAGKDGSPDARLCDWHTDRGLGQLDNGVKGLEAFLGRSDVKIISNTDESSEWVITDVDCKQRYKVVSENCYLFEEERVVEPSTGKRKMFSAEIDLSEYTQTEMFEDVSCFGYSFNEMCSWLDEGENLSLIAECIFEMTEV